MLCCVDVAKSGERGSGCKEDSKCADEVYFSDKTLVGGLVTTTLG